MSSDPYPSSDRDLPAASLGRSVITTKFVPASGRYGARVRASTEDARKPATYNWKHELDIPGNHARAAKLAAAAWFTGCGRVELTGAHDKPGRFSWTVHDPRDPAELPGLAILGGAHLDALNLAERLDELAELDSAAGHLAGQLDSAGTAARALARQIAAELQLPLLQHRQLEIATERANALAARLDELQDTAGDLQAERLDQAILAARQLAASIQSPPTR